MPTELRHRQRHRNEAGLHRAEKGDDVFEPLRGEDGGPIAGLPDPQKLFGDRLRSSIGLCPGDALGEAGRIHLVVDKRKSHGVGLRPRSLSD